MTHLLVTNDFPPKHGGIQNLLWELWRRLDPQSFAVLTTPFDGAARFDAAQPFRTERVREPVLIPQPALARRVSALAEEIGATTVVLDPALPLGLLGPFLDRPYVVLAHGAEVTVPGRLPLTAALLGRVLRGARQVVAFGGYPAAEARRATGPDAEIVCLAPGIDTSRFDVLEVEQRRATRADLGLPGGPLVLTLSRLVPRKGVDVLIDAVSRLAPEIEGLTLAVGGDGRNRDRLQRRARDLAAPVRFLGRVPADELARLYAASDVFAMVCRNRWFGLEQEGFGIVFLEAAAAGVPQVAGNSGGAHEAVVHGTTGFVVEDPRSVDEVVDRLRPLLMDGELAARMGDAARRRAVEEFDYSIVAERLAAIAQQW